MGFADVPGRSMLRLVACGSVDDGKSTLIGRLIAATGSVADDHMQRLAGLSRRYSPTGGELDCAFLLDGLEAEREQGIAIDVACRFFATGRRDFIVVDAPGHEQLTRNVVMGAASAELALILVDSRHGLVTQTMRHARIAALLAVRHVVLAVNKMDLVNFDQGVFDAIATAFADFSSPLGFSTRIAIPICARDGDNVTEPSARMPWYRGPTILGRLEAADVPPAAPVEPRFLVQNAVRHDGELLCCGGLMVSGSLARGDTVQVACSGALSRISRIFDFHGDLESAPTGRALFIELADHVDVGRGDVIAPAEAAAPHVADQLAAHVVWFDERPLLPGRYYKMQIGTRLVDVTVTTIKYKVQVETGARLTADVLESNDIGVCNLATAEPIAFDAYDANRATGRFILIDGESGATGGAGMVSFPLRRAHNIRRQAYDVDQAARARMKGQRPFILWFTGLSGAGKSTIMNLVERNLHGRGMHTYALDGDNLRLGLNRDLGFTDADRVENIRRAGEIGGLMVEAGLVVLCAFISPFRAERHMIRERVGHGQFVEVFVDTPLHVCIERDAKGLYAKARAGQARHVPGIDTVYEPPDRAEIHLVTVEQPAEIMAVRVVCELVRLGLIEP